MHVFITGATGFLGRELIRELSEAGYQITGLSRSQQSAEQLAAMGAQAHPGSLEDLDSLRRGALAADATIHLAFSPDFSRFQENCRADQRAIQAIGSALIGTAKPLIVPNGIAGLTTSGEVATEDTAIPTDYRYPRLSEQTALGLASQGVLASVIRLPQVHNRKRQGLVRGLFEIASRTRVSAYIGAGENRWPAAHVMDVARLFRLVLEAPRAGARYNAVAEEGILLKDLARTISQVLDVPTRSLTREQAREHFGWLGMFAAEDMPATSWKTREETGWKPVEATMLDDLAHVGT